LKLCWYIRLRPTGVKPIYWVVA